jgi:excisionase family DNA binding protein
MIKQLLTVTDVATKLKVSRRTVFKMLSASELPKPDISTGRIRRWHPDTIDKWTKGDNHVD